jgi:pimeloyl-ACP methyl ester carboxylesterase
MRADLIAARRLGAGPLVVLVHGGIGPELSWERQLPLAERWTLLIPSRRGFEPSPPAERQDWEVDVDDLEALLEAEDGTPAHLVGFSYGGVCSSIVAAQRPEMVRSLTLIEPPLYSLDPDDPAIADMIDVSERFFSTEPSEDPEAHWRFLAIAGVDRPQNEEQAREIEHATGLARRLRSPADAAPDLEAVRDAGIPVLSVSGSDRPGLVRICDLVAERTGGERVIVEGARHAVQRSPGFNERLEEFLNRVESGSRP